MGLRQRERIQRNTENEQTCGACGSSMLDTWSRIVRVAGRNVNLCTTCQGAARGGDQVLADHLHELKQAGVGDVNDDLLDRIDP